MKYIKCEMLKIWMSELGGVAIVLLDCIIEAWKAAGSQWMAWSSRSISFTLVQDYTCYLLLSSYKVERRI